MSSCFHLEAFYYFPPLNCHSFVIGDAVTRFWILYNIQRNSNPLPFTYTSNRNSSPPQRAYTKGISPPYYTGKLIQTETTQFAWEIQEVWHKAKMNNPNSWIPIQLSKHKLVGYHTCWKVGHKLNYIYESGSVSTWKVPSFSPTNPSAGAGEKGKEAKQGWAG